MRRIFNGFREHHLPLSVLYMDIDYWMATASLRPI